MRGDKMFFDKNKKLIKLAVTGYFDEMLEDSVVLNTIKDIADEIKEPEKKAFLDMLYTCIYSNKMKFDKDTCLKLIDIIL
jgi:hypothetical protein